MKKNIIIVLILFSTLSVSCNKWLTIQPETMLTEEDMYKTKEGFKDALIGVYLSARDIYKLDGDFTSGAFEHLACMWDGVQPATIQEEMNLHEYGSDAFDNKMAQPFRLFYKTITDANLVLKNLENGVLEEYEYTSYRGQLLVARAFMHFELLRLWGPMPGGGVDGKKYLPYVKKMQISPYDYQTYNEYMENIYKDMEEALLLLEKIDKADKAAGHIIITDSDTYFMYPTALALFSRMALWHKDNTKAVDYATKLMEYNKTEKKYSLGNLASMNDGDYVLKSEHIFRFPFTVTMAPLTQLFLYIPSFDGDLFANCPNDIRRRQWVEETRKEGQSDVPIQKLIKLEVKIEFDSQMKPKETRFSVPVIRLGEIYLILIECLEITAANELYKEFCEAREVDYIPFTDANRIDVLMKEYRKEFILENQLFCFYKRMNIKNMPRCARVCNIESYVLPIPSKESGKN